MSNNTDTNIDKYVVLKESGLNAILDNLTALGISYLDEDNKQLIYKLCSGAIDIIIEQEE